MKKLILFLLPFLIIPSISALNTYNYTGFNFTLVETHPEGITWNGSSFFVLDNAGVTDRVYEYNSSGNTTGFNFTINRDDNPEGITWNGSSFFIVGDGSNVVMEYNVTGGYAGFNFSVNTQVLTPRGITHNGSNFFVSDGGGTVYIYLNNGTYVDSIAVSELSTAEGLAWNEPYLFAVGSAASDKVYAYNSSKSYTGVNFSVRGESTSTNGMTWDGESFYIVSTDTDRVYEYKQKASVIYNNYYAYQNQDYVRNLTYTVNINCLEETYLNISRYTNYTNDNNQLINCTSNVETFTGEYTHDTERNYTIYFRTNHSDNIYFGNSTFVSDLYNPTIPRLRIDINEFNSTNSNISMQCSDTLSPIITYNFTLNEVNYRYANFSNGTIIHNITEPADNTNNLTGICSDFIGNTVSASTPTVYKKTLYLIDEIENTAFDVNNLSEVKAYKDNNQSYFDFKSSNVSEINYTSTGYNKLRFELEYSDGTVITRYIDVGLLDEQVRVCANKDGTTHYEQLIISTSQRVAKLKSLFANCYVAADYTRFGYQENYLLKAFTIDRNYEQVVIQDGEEVVLIGVDGSVASYINLDTIELSQREYDLGITDDHLAFRKTSDNTIQIYYLNDGADNTALSMSIYRMDTDEEIYSNDDFTNMDEFTVYYDYTVLTDINDTTQYKIELTKTNADGQSTIRRYFNTFGDTGIIPAAIAAAAAFLLMIFGLTFTMTRLSFSWFGIFMVITALAILSFAISTWYITFMMAMCAVILVYIVIIMYNQNYPTLAG